MNYEPEKSSNSERSLNKGALKDSQIPIHPIDALKHDETYSYRSCHYELCCSNIRYASGPLLNQLRTRSTRSYHKYASQEKNTSWAKFVIEFSEDVNPYPEPDPILLSATSVDSIDFSLNERLTSDTSEPFLTAPPAISSCASDGNSNKLQKPDGSMCEPSEEEPREEGNSSPNPSDASFDPSILSIFNIPDGTACRHPKYPKHLCCDGPAGRAEKDNGYVHMAYVDVCFLCKLSHVYNYLLYNLLKSSAVCVCDVFVYLLT